MDYSDRKISEYQLERIEPSAGGWAVTLRAQLYTQDGGTAGPTIVKTVVVPKINQSIEEIVLQAVQLALAVSRRLAEHDPNDLTTLALTTP